VRDLEAICSRSTLRAPVVQGSAWMACIPGALARAAADSFDTVDSIDISILYALKDKSGDDSVEYMDRLTVPFPVMRDGRSATAVPFAESRRATFANGHTAKGYRFDTPDQHILPSRTGAKSVAAFLSFDDRMTTTVFWMIVRSGLWDLMSGERFTKLRRGLLHNPGPGAPHHVRVDVVGTTGGKAAGRTIQITDDAGQTHLTAVGAALQVEWVLGLNGFDAAAPGVGYGEDIAPLGTFHEALESLAIAVAGTP
jgi:saccharopine dehydrogenase-like NADP-dependent oxidoreductase